MLVTPKVLEFQAPLKGQTQTQKVIVKNETDTSIAFKVKTTAPKLYCVRPNSASLAPGSSMDVTIIFQGLSEEPAVGTKCKDKFLFVSVPCDDSVHSKDVASIWSDLQKSAGQTTDSKIKVAYIFDNSMNTIQEEDKHLQLDSHAHTLPTSFAAGQNKTELQQTQKQVSDNIPAVHSANASANASATVSNPVEQFGPDSISPAITSSFQKSEVTSLQNSESQIKSTGKPVESRKETIIPKTSKTIAPPSAPVKKQDTNIYMWAIVLVLAAFILSRLF